MVVATDGAAGHREAGPARLAAVRESETRGTLGRLGLEPGDVTFLGYADGGLATAWNDWQAARRDVGNVSADAPVDALRVALRVSEHDTVVLPMPLDHHPDHAALGRFAMLAVLAARGEPELLAYLMHGGPGGPGSHGTAGCGRIPGPGGCNASFFWASLPLDPGAMALKAALIDKYRSQPLGASVRSPRRTSRSRAASWCARTERCRALGWASTARRAGSRSTCRVRPVVPT